MRIVNVHHVDKANFLKGNVDCVDNEEVVMVFVTTPTYVEVVKRVRMDLKWMDPSDDIELVGRYNSGPSQSFENYACQLRVELECIQGDGSGIRR